jgi:hypothetical protein
MAEDTADNQVNDDSANPADIGTTTYFGDDGSIQYFTAGGTTTYFGDSPAVTPTQIDITTNSGTTTQGSAGGKTLANGKSPTVRANPLGYFSSYSYQLTLYMLTPDAINAFRAGGRRNISDLVVNSSVGNYPQGGGAYVVCQSGGTNNQDQARAPGFNLDYYIDNLQIQSIVSPNESMNPTTSTKLTFNITEPYGFSFLSRLKLAADTIDQYSGTLNNNSQNNASRQYFVLGIRFYGYDKYGNLLTGKEVIDGRAVDPAGKGNGLFETFYDILFKKVTFKIDGKATVYNIEAVSVNSDTLSIKNNILPCQITVEATTVQEALLGETGLIPLINKYWQEMVDNNSIEIGFRFNLEFIGNFNDLQESQIVLPEDTTKWKWPIKRDPNDPVGIKVAPDPTKRMISFSNTPSMSVTNAIEKIISLSSFLSDSLKLSYTNDVEPNRESNEEDIIVPDTVSYFRWFNITTNTKILGFDTKQKDYVYEITFVLSPYETPIVLSPYVKNLPPYYGPVKRYEYWFTGKNTEVISYEQQNNNGYFLVSLDPTLNEEENTYSATANIPVRPNFQQNVDHTGRLFVGSEALGSITTNLYDPKSYSNAKVTILGDPDFLVQDSLNYDPNTKAFNQFYAQNGTTVNPTGGQIFIEIDFKEGVDYNDKSGLMDINDNITFWQYPENIKKMVKGVSFQVKKIQSYFRAGKFTQDLEMFINQFADNTNFSVSNNTGRENTQDTISSSNNPGNQALTGSRSTIGSAVTGSGNSTSGNNGFKQDPRIAEVTIPPVQNPIITSDDFGTTTYFGPSEEGRE